MIAKQLLEGHKILCIMVSLDIDDKDIIQSDNYSSRTITIDFYEVKNNIANQLTKGLTKRLV